MNYSSTGILLTIYTKYLYIYLSKFLLDFLEVTLVDEIMQVSGAQFRKASSVDVYI